MPHVAIIISMMAVGIGMAALVNTFYLSKLFKEAYLSRFKTFVAVNLLYVFISAVYNYLNINVFEIAYVHHLIAAFFMLLIPLLSVYFYFAFTRHVRSARMTNSITISYVVIAGVLMATSFYTLIADARGWFGFDPTLSKSMIYAFYYLAMLASLISLYLAIANEPKSNRKEGITKVILFYVPYFSLLASAKLLYILAFISESIYLTIYYGFNLTQGTAILLFARKLVLQIGVGNGRAGATNGLNADLLSALSISNREQEIIGLICEGKSNKEISDDLFIAVATVKDHIHNIYQKTSVRNRVQLANMFYGSRSN